MTGFAFELIKTSENNAIDIIYSLLSLWHISILNFLNIQMLESIKDLVYL